jgi:hypothetical protein
MASAGDGMNALRRISVDGLEPTGKELPLDE